MLHRLFWEGLQPELRLALSSCRAGPLAVACHLPLLARHVSPSPPARPFAPTCRLPSDRKTLGLDVDPAVEARAQALYDQGVALFEQGLLTAALPK